MVQKLYDETPDRASNLFSKQGRSAALGSEADFSKGLSNGSSYMSKLSDTSGPQLVANPSELEAGDLGLSNHEYNQLTRKDKRELQQLAAALMGGEAAGAEGSEVASALPKAVREGSSFVENSRKLQAAKAMRGAADLSKRTARSRIAAANKIARRAAMASGAPALAASDMDVDADAEAEVGDKAKEAVEKAVSSARTRAAKREAMLAAQEMASANSATAVGASMGNQGVPGVAERAAQLSAESTAKARASQRLGAKGATAAKKAAAKAKASAGKAITRILQRRRAVTARALASGGKAAAASRMGAMAVKGGAAAGAGGAAAIPAGGAAAAIFGVAAVVVILILFIVGTNGGEFGAGGNGIAAAAEAEYALCNAQTGDGKYALNGTKYKEDQGGGINDAWCGYFASYCIKQAGVEEALGLPSGKLQNGWHDYWVTVFGSSSKYLTVHVNDGKYTPQRGDLAIRCAAICPTDSPAGVIEAAKGGSGEGHVGIVVFANSPGSYVTIEGNAGGNTIHCKGYGYLDPTYTSDSGETYALTDRGCGNTFDYFVTINAGGSGNIPEPWGNEMTFEDYSLITDTTSPEWKLKNKAKWKYKDGFAMLEGRYLVACTPKFGKVGDKIDFTLTDGTVIHCIKGETKSLKDKNCNEWGHIDPDDPSKHSVVEFLVNGTLPDNPGTDKVRPEWKGLRVCNWKNLGSAGYI